MAIAGLSLISAPNYARQRRLGESSLHPGLSTWRGRCGPRHLHPRVSAGFQPRLLSSIAESQRGARRSRKSKCQNQSGSAVDAAKRFKDVQRIANGATLKLRPSALCKRRRPVVLPDIPLKRLPRKRQHIGSTAKRDAGGNLRTSQHGSRNSYFWKRSSPRLREPLPQP